MQWHPVKDPVPLSSHVNKSLFTLFTILPGLNMNSKTASSEILLAAILDYKKRKEKYKKKKRQEIAAYLLFITPVRKKKVFRT